MNLPPKEDKNQGFQMHVNGVPQTVQMGQGNPQAKVVSDEL